MPSAATAISEVILETAIREPLGIINMVDDLGPIEGTAQGVGAIVVINGALGNDRDNK